MLTDQLTFRFVEQTAAEVSPKPFLKWAGGKSQLLEQFAPLFPTRFERYCEPFAGSAAAYWHLFTLREKSRIDFCEARLTDSNRELINCYTVVRNDIEQLIEQLTTYKKQHNRTQYYKVRGLDTNRLAPVERAARFIYLNKTCYNGLYRVNRSGQFNVPMGSYKNPGIFDEDALMKASQALQGVDIQVADFREALSWAREGDFIYFDPPYAPVSKTSSFTGYTEAPFGDREQKELANTFRQLSQRGCKLMLSNSWVHSTLALYKEFNCIEVKASRAINSNPDGRGKISELLVINYVLET